MIDYEIEEIDIFDDFGCYDDVEYSEEISIVERFCSDGYKEVLIYVGTINTTYQ